MKKYKIGLKLWSINKNYNQDIVDLYKNNYFDYIELYIKPGTYDEFVKFWQTHKIPYTIHAPHYGDGVNLSERSKIIYNQACYNESARFADQLNADYIIFHPGVNGKLEETVRQLVILNDKRIIIENKPRYGLNNENCIGYSPEEISLIKKETGYNCCLDFGHAICAAKSLSVNHIDYIKSFIKLQPVVFHLTDGDINSSKDIHEHYGKGNFPIAEIVSLIPSDSKITNEAKKNSNSDLNCFRDDIEYLCKLF